MRGGTMKDTLVSVRRIALFAAAATLVSGLAACSSDEEMAEGTPFTQALAKDYSDLSAQAGALPAMPTEESFLESLNPFANDETSSEQLAKAFAAKAALAAAGTQPEPENGNSALQTTSRARLLRAVAATKDQFPQQAARASADYDCWVLYSAVTTAAQAAQQCRSGLETSLTALETPARMATAPAPVALPSDAPPTASAPASVPSVTPPTDTLAKAAPVQDTFTVYFDFDSWTLKAEQLTVLDAVIARARVGGQSNIDIVGHTDTSGSAAYNQALSIRRANVVVEALVQMGARRTALHASGVGEKDLAVQTADNVKEARNRRTVIGLRP